MRMNRFLSLVSFITCFSLLYVYQQTEIFSLAYLGQKKEVLFQDLLDKNSILRYNINKSASLVRIGTRISSSKDYQMPDTYRFVRLRSAKGSLVARDESANKETILSRIFGIKRQAEAETINR